MKKNTATFTGDDIATIFPKSTALLPADWQCCGISTDTRAIVDGSMFVALRGDNHDGHDYLHQAAERGASAAIIAADFEGSLPAAVPCIKVEDTLVALGALAEYHRKRFTLPVIAIAGAAGKTTTKDMTALLCSMEGEPLFTEANYNNRVGVPLTLLQLHEKHRFAVIEIGTNEPGEIACLAAMVAPTHGLITNIGKEHLEKLGDIDGVEHEETALFRYLAAHGGQPIVNMDDERLAKFTVLPLAFTYGQHPNAMLRATFSTDAQGFVFVGVEHDGKRAAAHLQSVGLVSGINAVAAIAAAVSMGIALEKATGEIARYSPEASAGGYGRMVVEKLDGGVTLLNDCYNANPISMRTALQTLFDMPAHGKRFAILGDMFELGDVTEEEHTSLLAECIASDKLHEIIIVGEHFAKAYHGLEVGAGAKVTLAYSVGAIATLLRTSLSAGDIALVKGSRGMKMEKIVADMRSS